MWKSNVTNIFHISIGLPECQQVKTPNYTVKLTRREFVKTRGTLVPDLPHMPAHSRQSGRQNIITRTHTWQQCSVSTSGAILTTKYGFNLRQNSPLNIENNTGYSGLIRVSVAHAQIGPLKLAHFWSDIRWFPILLFQYIPLHDWKSYSNTFRCMIGKGPGKQS